MSRKLTLTLTALATIVSATLVANADAMAARGGGAHFGGGGRIGHVGHVGHTGRTIPGGRIGIHRPGRFVGHRPLRGRYFVYRYGFAAPVAVGYVRPLVSDPSLCTCLTKTYTQEGNVVFQDLCTKETASAPVNGAAGQSSQNVDPNNFAGRSYEDYLKANPQPAQANAQLAPAK